MAEIILDTDPNMNPLRGSFSLADRAAFEDFTGRLFEAAELLWPSVAEPGESGEIAPRKHAAADGEVAGLTGRDRRARMLALKEQGRSAREIADIFGTSPKAVEVACTNARKDRAEAGGQ